MNDLFAPVVSITTTKRRRFFWAAWWSAPPWRTPFRKPDASHGGARTLEEARDEAAKAAGRELVEIEPQWSRAWSRILRGQDPWPGGAKAHGDRVAGERAPAAEPSQRTSIWTVLGIDAKASADEVKRAYRKRALETHPDRGGDAEVFRRVQRAYELALARTRRAATKPKRRNG